MLAVYLYADGTLALPDFYFSGLQTPIELHGVVRFKDGILGVAVVKSSFRVVLVGFSLRRSSYLFRRGRPRGEYLNPQNTDADVSDGTVSRDTAWNFSGEGLALIVQCAAIGPTGGRSR